jgi:hypothetical protein
VSYTLNGGNHFKNTELKIDYQKLMTSLTDRQLVQMTEFDAEDYLNETLIEAKKEIEYRNLQVDQLIEQIVSEKIQNENINANINPAYIKWLILVLLPLIALPYSLIEIFGVFMLPIIITCCFPCGLISLIAVKTINSSTVNEIGIRNERLGLIIQILSVVDLLISFIGFSFIFAFLNS